MPALDTTECILIVAPDGRLSFISLAGLALLRANSFQEVEGIPLSDRIAEEYRQEWVEIQEKRLSNGEAIDWRFEIIRLDQTRLPVEAHGVPLVSDHGKSLQLALTDQSTAAPSTGKVLKRDELVLQAQRQALELALHGASLSEVLDVLSLCIEKQSSDRIYASILLVDQEGTRLIHVSAPNLPPAYSESLTGRALKKEAGFPGTAPFTGKEGVISDIATDPLWKNYKDAALKHGLLVCWCTPVLSSANHLLATIAIYYGKRRMPAKDDQNAVALFSQTTGIIIEWFREIAQRREAEAALRRSDQYLRALMTATSDVIYRMSADWKRMWTLYGQNFLADSFDAIEDWQAKYILPEDRGIVDAAIKDAIAGKSSFQLEHRVIQADGAVGWTFSRAIPILDNEGNILVWPGHGHH